MKELSLNILDIAMNSVRADACRISIGIEETDLMISVTIKDDGCGMTPEFLAGVLDPFTTTRTTRKVGMGLPLLKLAAEQTGGSLTIESRDKNTYPDDHGTETIASLYKGSIDYTPLGDIISTLLTLVQGNPEIHWIFIHNSPCGTVEVDTAEMSEILGDISLSDPDVLNWLRTYLNDCYDEIGYKL